MLQLESFAVIDRAFRLMVACLRRKVERTSVLSPVPFQGPKRFFSDSVRERKTPIIDSVEKRRVT